MARYLTRRLFWAGMTFIAITLFTFVMFFVVPSDPARLFAASDDPDSVLRMRHTLALDHPIYIQYLQDLKRLVVEHSLGYSFRTRQDVGTAIAGAAPVSIALVAGGILIATITSFLV